MKPSRSRAVCDAEQASIIEMFDERRPTFAGFPAGIVGRGQPFATVFALAHPASIRADFAWPTVRRILTDPKYSPANPPRFNP